jgi:hypothetical protein
VSVRCGCMEPSAFILFELTTFLPADASRAAAAARSRASSRRVSALSVREAARSASRSISLCALLVPRLALRSTASEAEAEAEAEAVVAAAAAVGVGLGRCEPVCCTSIEAALEAWDAALVARLSAEPESAATAEREMIVDGCASAAAGAGAGAGGGGAGTR